MDGRTTPFERNSDSVIVQGRKVQQCQFYFDSEKDEKSIRFLHGKHPLRKLEQAPRMSYKSKNLSYEAQEPAFLRKLRAQQAGTDTDRLERPVARPKRVKTADDDDDGPTIVDPESNQTLSKEEYEKLVADEENKDAGGNANALLEDGNRDDVKTQRKKQEVTEAGQGQKKRKAVKAVAVDGEDQAAETKPATNDGTAKPLTKKPKKKVKTVKLSFDEEE